MSQLTIKLYSDTPTVLGQYNNANHDLKISLANITNTWITHMAWVKINEMLTQQIDYKKIVYKAILLLITNLINLQYTEFAPGCLMVVTIILFSHKILGQPCGLNGVATTHIIEVESEPIQPKQVAETQSEQSDTTSKSSPLKSKHVYYIQDSSDFKSCWNGPPTLMNNPKRVVQP